MTETTTRTTTTRHVRGDESVAMGVVETLRRRAERADARSRGGGAGNGGNLLDAGTEGGGVQRGG